MAKRLLLNATLRLVAAATLMAPLAPWAQPVTASPWDSADPTQGIDPPTEVARLNLAEGAVSFAPADAGTGPTAWRAAVLNRPLTSGDRLWTGAGARSELHMGSSAVRMSEQTSLDFVTLTDSLAQLHLAQGSLQLRVRTLYEGQRLQIDTPNLAFVITAPGDYRIDVDPARNTTRVVAQAGQGMLYGDKGSMLNLGARQQGNFSGTQLTPATPGPAYQDRFDAWASARDQQEDASVSARYIPRETLGYQQLDTYGDWQQSPDYGAIWMPRSVPANWAPYRAGHWSWINPWGWTWIDDQPWGFAPFHYGRWAEIGSRWAWVPGAMSARPVYAPALVAFIGGSNNGMNWGLSGSGGASQPSVGWFPLAPGEAYRPVYRASPRYLQQINPNSAFRHQPGNAMRYRYQQLPSAVTAARQDDFVAGEDRRLTLGRLSAEELAGSRLLQGPGALPFRPARDIRVPRPAQPISSQPPSLGGQRPNTSFPQNRLPPVSQQRQFDVPPAVPENPEERKNTLGELSRQRPMPVQAPEVRRLQPPPAPIHVPPVRVAPTRVVPVPQEVRGDVPRESSLRQLDEERKRMERARTPEPRRFTPDPAQGQGQGQGQVQPEPRREPPPEPVFKRDPNR